MCSFLVTNTVHDTARNLTCNYQDVLHEQIQGGRILLNAHHQSTMPFVHSSMYLDLLHPIKEISNMTPHILLVLIIAELQNINHPH